MTDGTSRTGESLLTAAHASVPVSFSQRFLDEISRWLIEHQRYILPDISSWVIMLPGSQAAPLLRQCLLRAAAAHGYPALMGPHITTLHQWVEQNTPLERLRLNHLSRQLALVDVIKPHLSLFGIDDPWAIARALGELFDELHLQDLELEDGDDAFVDRLRRAYGLDVNLPLMEKEATMVYHLWQAWKQQCEARRQLDAADAYRRKLLRHARLEDKHRYIFAGPAPLHRIEAAWLLDKQQQGRLCVFTQGTIPTILDGQNETAGFFEVFSTAAAPPGQDEDAFGAILDSIFQKPADRDMQQQSRYIKKRFSENPFSRLRLLESNNAEQQAHAVELQVRQWLLKDKRNIGIITEDRRLARRIRALLERAGILLQDQSGWAMSTTSAASVLEHWLQCIEQDFEYQGLLALLKSPFFQYHLPRASLLKLIYRFEQDIILHENIGSGLQHYRHAIDDRHRRLAKPWMSEQSKDDLLQLMDFLQDASQNLRELQGSDGFSARAGISALLESLTGLGLSQTLSQDAAGETLMDLLHELQSATRYYDLKMDWQEFRGWVGRALEQSYFVPPHHGHGVFLLSLSQSHGFHFDALVIAGAERRFLPGPAPVCAFFNNPVRMQLGLWPKGWHIQYRFYLFRRLLQCADRILITASGEIDGEPVTLSPWVELLKTYTMMAYQDDLSDAALEKDIAEKNYWITDRDQPPPPPYAPARAQVPADLLPEQVSASAYQQMVDCPYQFYVARCLKLSPPEEIRLALQKSDYGERVHQCLHAFHAGTAGMAPFPKPLTEAHRQEAVEYLARISRKIFAADIEDSFQHRGWLKRWLNTIPMYIDWQLRRHPRWQPHQAEQMIRNDRLIPGLSLRGRIDRIDRDDDGRMAVLDYKTGSAPKPGRIMRGESVQLPFYHLLYPTPVDTVTVVSLDQDKVTENSIQGDTLQALSEKNASRLKSVFKDIKNGDMLPAWGDGGTCRYCSFKGICRRIAGVED